MYLQKVSFAQGNHKTVNLDITEQMCLFRISTILAYMVT